jgi:hypothetical protein
VGWVDPWGLAACPEGTPPQYRTQDHAAKAAFKKVNPLSINDNLEYGGLIFRDNRSGRYGFTGPIKGSDQGVNPHAAQAPHNSSLVGDYHTHGDYSLYESATGKTIRTSDLVRDAFNSDNFSPQDISGISADGKGIPGYKGYLGTPSGIFKVYDPSKRSVYILK